MEDIPTEVARWKKRSIYRVPASVIDLNKTAYKPQTVSLGPYHHDEVHLKAMEEHKHRALLHFLKRSGKPIELYVDALAEVADNLKDAYDQLATKWKLETEEFLELMILDGCFILEIARTATQTLNDYAPNDPIFSTHGKLYIVPYLKRDMLMLENQLPLLVLEKLVAVEKGNSKGEEKIVNKLIVDFFSQKPVRNMGKCLHILDLYRKNLLEEPPQKKHHKKSHPKVHHGEDEIIRSAAELNEAGIQIKKSKTKSLKEISFHRGVLKLPQIVVDDTTESMYLNLIAFERLHVGAGNEVTSYIFFMDNIIDSARDVSLLHSSGIIQNAIGSDKAVAKLFNSLSKDVTLDPESRLEEVHKKVSNYCKKPWNAWRADIMHNYFRNPWAILSVIAAIFLFALTIIQTVYGVLSYVKPP
ncbi:unnamed protein product [Fraxinus pennsylvanica]|uniref:Uncharacterized protein n=1 Tax=Fraxinus pennsylvanica TaxID=56036 RepID=A0AAD1ZTW2_9LAMI|nr:unnamed protein product [Fraxinus pennsylvanica]